MSPSTIVRCAKDVFTTIILQNFHVFILLKISDQSVYETELNTVLYKLLYCIIQTQYYKTRRG